jgi:hypothetical protein
LADESKGLGEAESGPGRDQSVTSLAERVLGSAVGGLQIAAADVDALVRAVLGQAPEAVRLALEIAELGPADPMRGPLGLQLAAAALALRPAAGRGRTPTGCAPRSAR